MILKSSKLYDTLKFIALVALPVLGALYFGLARIADIPHLGTILGIILVIDACLGAVVQLSSRAYTSSDVRFDGQMDVHELGSKKVVQMAFNDEKQLETLTEKKEVRFKVNQLD